MIFRDISFVTSFQPVLISELYSAHIAIVRRNSRDVVENYAS